MKTILRRVSVQVGLGFAALVSAACSGSSGGPTPLAIEQTVHDKDSTKGAATSEKEESKNPFVKALDDLQLKPDQLRDVDELRSEAHQRHQPVKQAKAALMSALADAIEKGDVDRCALDSQIKALASAKAKANKGDRKAVERLHEILTPDQRAKFADALKGTLQAQKKAHEGGAMLKKISDELSLTDDQKAGVKKIFDATKAIRDAERGGTDKGERLSKIVDAFKTDCFVLDKIAPSCDVRGAYETRIEDMIDATRHVVSILDKEQRSKLAYLIREKAKEHGEAERGEGTPSAMPQGPAAGMPQQPGMGLGPQVPMTGLGPQAPMTGFGPQLGAGMIGPQLGAGFGPQQGAGYGPQQGAGYGPEEGAGYGPQQGAGVGPQLGGQPNVGPGAQQPGEMGQQQPTEESCPSSAEHGQYEEQEAAQTPSSTTHEHAGAGEDLGLASVASGVGACVAKGAHD